MRTDQRRVVMSRPGQVASDEQAFRQILRRLDEEVGAIFRLVEEAKQQKGQWPKSAPHWALVRMTFPIAESIGDLIYRNDNSTVQNLRSVLENEFDAARPGYRGKSAVLALLYWHALTHQDELQSLLTAGRELGWWLSYGDTKGHLSVTQQGNSFWMVHFDTIAFYNDIGTVCRTAMGRQWNGSVMNRYNAWLTMQPRYRTIE